MKDTNYTALCAYAQAFSQLDQPKIATLQDIYPDLRPHLDLVADHFYEHLRSIPKIQPLLKKPGFALPQAYSDWLHQLFTDDFGTEYTQTLYELGNTFVTSELPIEFMTGSMSIIQGYLIGTLKEVYHDNPTRLLDALIAINSAMGFSGLVMQEAYQATANDNELERFLSITGMSRNLFENMARAYR